MRCALLLVLLSVLSGCGGEQAAPGAPSPPRSSRRANVGPILDRARDRLRDDDLPGAVSAYREVLAIEPDHAASLYSLALLLRRLGRPEEAIDLLDRLAEVDGIPSRAHLLKAAILTDPDYLPADPDEARRALERAAAETGIAVRANPEDSGTHAAHGRVLLLLGRVEAARRELSRALGLNPRDEDSALWLAIASVRAGDRESARRTLLEHGADRPPRPAREGVAEEGDTATGSAAKAVEGARARRLLVVLGAPSPESLPAGDVVPPAPERRADPLGCGLPFAAEVLFSATRAYRIGEDVVLLRGSGIAARGEDRPRRFRLPSR